MLLSLKRIIRTGFLSFWRNGFVSVSSVVVMTITLFVASSLLCINALLSSSLSQLKDKVDINAYFVIDANEADMLALRDTVSKMPEVRSVVYTSRDEALTRFKERHAQDVIELQALNELGENPLLASLSIQANDPSNYEQINNFLTKDTSVLAKNGDPLIAKVNFNDNRTAITRLQQVIRGIEVFGLALSLVLGVTSIVIVFNTIRMAIYIAREEIAVMRLVGASDAYIRGPFVCEGMLYGVVSALITLVVLYPLVLWLGPITRKFFGSTDVLTLYTSHFGKLFLGLVLAGVVLGGVSSFLSVKKYLKI